MTDSIAAVDRVAQEAFAYFAGPGRTTTARVDRWLARDVLMHFLYFHNATAWGIESGAPGGPPWPLPADADTINEVSGVHRTPTRPASSGRTVRR